MATMTEECRKCNRRYKRLTKGRECFYCNPEQWSKEYQSEKGKK